PAERRTRSAGAREARFGEGAPPRTSASARARDGRELAVAVELEVGLAHADAAIGEGAARAGRRLHEARRRIRRGQGLELPGVEPVGVEDAEWHAALAVEA